MSDDAETAAPEDAATPPETAPDGPPADGGTPDAPPSKDGEQAAKTPRDYNRMFAALSRKEKAFRDQVQTHEKTAASQAADLKELAAYRAHRQAARQNPKAWLEAGGLDRDAIARAFEAPGPDETAKQYEARFAAMQKQIEERDLRYQNVLVEQAKSRYIDQITQVVNSDPAAYELLQAEGRQADVYELMDRYYQEHNEVLPIPRACQVLEDVLAEQFESDAKRIQGYKKLASRLGWQSQTEDQPGQPPPAAPTKNAPRKTLSHRGTPASSPTRKADTAPRSPEAEWADMVRKYEQS